MQTETMKTNGHPAPPVRPELAILKVAEVEPHPNNPRKTFVEIEALGASIAEHGQLEPIMVRPRGKGKFQIVFGERRWRAIKKAGLVDVLAIVRELSDEQCEEIMVVENTKRADLHPLEEAEGYERLHTVHGKSVKEIAAKVGKTIDVIYGRMKLLALCKKAREAFYAGQIDVSKALLIARIPHEDLQLEAVKAITKPREIFEADLGLEENFDRRAEKVTTELTYREAFQIVQSRFMLRLVDAPFDRADTKLTPAGACTTCPKRTGNQKELFADVASSDVCIDPKCYRTKVDAEWTRRAAIAKEAKQPVLGVTEAKKVFNRDGGIAYGADFLDVDEEGYYGAKRTTLRKKLGDKLPPTTLARDAEGNIHELVPKAAARTVERTGASTGTKLTASEKKEREKQREQNKKERAKRAVETKCDELAIAAIVEKAATKQPTAELWRALVVSFIRTEHFSYGGNDCIAEVLVGRKLAKDLDEGVDLIHEPAGVARVVAKLSEKTCRSLLVEIVATVEADAVRRSGDVGTNLGKRASERNAYDMLCDAYKVDPKKFHAEAKASVGSAKKE